MPGEEMLESMATDHEELQRAGVLRDANGLKPPPRRGACATTATSAP